MSSDVDDPMRLETYKAIKRFEFTLLKTKELCDTVTAMEEQQQPLTEYELAALRVARRELSKRITNSI
jgi:hypothetical protein